MLVKVVFLSLTLAYVTAQISDFCIPGAEPDGNGGCRCQNGLSGDPQLCCYNANQRGCYVSGDPFLTSFTGNKMGLDFPCGTMIASSRSDPSQPIINVFAAGKEVASGAIYTSQVKVELRQLAVITLTFNFDSSPFVVRYERSDGPSQDMTMEDGQSMSLNQDGVQGDIILKFNKGISLFSLQAGGIAINIRPSSGNSAQQATPGVCIMEPQGSVSPSPAVTQACGLSSDVINTPSYLDSAIQPMKNYMYNNGILKATTDPDYAGLCQAYQDTIVPNCDAADRYNAMKKCAFILFQPLIRRCFYEADIGSGRVMSAFLNCLNVYCQGTKVLCDELQSDARFNACAPNLKDCQTWPPYRRVNRFVAGEGDGLNFGNGDDNVNQGSATTEFNPDKFDILGTGGDDQNNGGAGGVDDGWQPPF